MSRDKLLREYVDAIASKVPDIGIDDCGPWVARWIEIACGISIEFPHYSTRDEGYAIAERAGGLVGLVAPLMASAGLYETATPRLGDVGIVRFPHADVAAIFCLEGMVVLRHEVGGYKLRQRPNVIRAWALP